jgi:hypothetical protein
MQLSDILRRLLRLFTSERESSRLARQASLDRQQQMEAQRRRIAEQQRQIDARRDAAHAQIADSITSSRRTTGSSQGSGSVADVVFQVLRETWLDARMTVQLLISKLRRGRTEGAPSNPARREASNWKSLVGAGMVLLAFGGLAATAAFIGARHLVWGRPITITPMAPLAAPGAIPYVPLPPGDGSPAASGDSNSDSCGLEFLEPIDGQEINVEGALAIEWSDAGEAASYLLELHPPDGTGSPWLIETKDTFRRIYMSNFPAEGDYELVVSALDADGYPICKTEFTFYKAAYLLAEAGDAGVGNQPGAVSPPGASPQITPTWDPADATIDYGACPGCDANNGDVIVK